MAPDWDKLSAPNKGAGIAGGTESSEVAGTASLTIAYGYDFDLLGNSDNGNSIISFFVNKHSSSDEDDDSSDTIVPLQVAYAVSIHKAQGLEYNSVKIVITDEIEEMITHNIFYTAITRARSNLKIYWSPESQQRVISRFEKMNARNDANIFAGHSGLRLLNRNV